jgi:hypothetical protein
MADEHYDIQKFLKLRKLTRSIADLLRGQLSDYIATLTPMLRPKSIFGEYVQGGAKESVRGADKAFLQLQRLYTAVINAKPYNLLTELTAPIQLDSASVEITPLEYSHVVSSDGGSKTIAVTSPLKWVVTYAGFSIAKLQELLANRNRMNEETHRFVLHYTALHVVLNSHPGLPRLLEALRFPVSSERFPQFGEMPIACISSSVSTIRPSDELIIQSTEISGRDAFEEVVNLDDLRNLQDPLKSQLLELAKSHGEELALPVS